jgi:hypothetical protein
VNVTDPKSRSVGAFRFPGAGPAVDAAAEPDDAVAPAGKVSATPGAPEDAPGEAGTVPAEPDDEAPFCGEDTELADETAWAADDVATVTAALGDPVAEPWQAVAPARTNSRAGTATR